MTGTKARGPLAIRDFRLLWLGEAISALGDQFALIALPWLALVMTGSALALGSVLAVMAVPRALLMVVGGVSVDRLSPRRVMLASNAVRLVAVTALGAVVLAGNAQLWMLYAFALVFGVADAFFFPAQTSIVPQLVEPNQLHRANAIVQGTAQASMLLGPALAGVVIAALAAGGATGRSAPGIAVALLVDAASFLASLACLWLIRARPVRPSGGDSMLEAIGEAVRYVGRSRGLRVIVLLSLAANLLLVGPFEIGIPVLAYARLPEGAAAFGVLMSAFGGGSLLGYAAGAILPTPSPARFATVVIGAIALAGVGLAALAAVDSTPLAALLTAGAGMALGYGNLLGLTWAQSRVPPELMGRVMSLLMLGSVGLVPVSQLVAGAAVQVSLDWMLMAAGSGMVLLTALALGSRAVRELGLEPPYEAPAGTASAGTTPAQSPA